MITQRAHLVFGLVLGLLWMSGSAVAQEGHGAIPERLSWTFAGSFGYFDEAQLQRGFKVFREVCANCHSMKLVPFRALSEEGGPGFSEAQVKALAAEYKIKDGPNDAGDIFDRPGRPSDYFPWNFANEQQARTALNGALPPDFSVLAKARAISRGFPYFLFDAVTQYQEHGPDYIYALLTGYGEPPGGKEMPAGMYYNRIMPGGQIAMPPPLSDGQVDYPDGSPKTVSQYAKDVAAFMMWVAEPKLEQRKRIGFDVLVFLVVFAGLLYFTKKKIWADVGH
jgi:ubiquinol-cytochrome c reductase cytochrome b/c1 subunit